MNVRYRASSAFAWKCRRSWIEASAYGNGSTIAGPSPTRPRMIVTNADSREGGSGSPTDCRDAAPLGRQRGWSSRQLDPQIAERLRFVHVGQRARAETIVQQRQPGLVESPGRRNRSRCTIYQPEFCRTLFQLMVPYEFKEAARKRNSTASCWFVDGYTANLPWELMLADQEPLAVTARGNSPTRVDPDFAGRYARRSSVAGLRDRQSIDGQFFRHLSRYREPQPERCARAAPTGAEREAEIVGGDLARHGYSRRGKQ